MRRGDSLTTDPSPPATKKRRLSAVDCGVFALAIGSLAAPFAMRLQVQAHAAGPQVAIPMDVPRIRPIDFAMGYEEQQAEAAFFEGLEEPFQTKTDAALDLALTLATEPSTPLDVIAPIEPATSVEVIALVEPTPLIEGAPSVEAPAEVEVVVDDIEPVTAPAALPEEPKPVLAIAVLRNKYNPDYTINADTSDTPPVIVEPVVEEVVVDVVTVPPSTTPMPTMRPRPAKKEDVEIAELDEEEIELPIDVTPPSDPAIEEAPLPPLVELEEIATQPIVSMTRDVTVEDPPTDTTLSEAAPAPDVALAPPVEPAPEAAVAPRIEPAPQAAPTVVAQKTPPPARQVAKITNGPRIALVITAAGLNSNATRYAIEQLPAGVTLAFAPVKAEATALAREAKADGHTILVEIPMEPINKKRDPGSLTLRGSNSPQQNLANLNQALALIPNADGASSYLGARFNADERAATPVLRAIANRGLFFFENEPTSRSVFQQIATRSDLRYARGIVKFDRARDKASILAALDLMERQARRGGVAVGVGTTLHGTISAVAEWAKEAEKRGVRLVPVTDLAR